MKINTVQTPKHQPTFGIYKITEVKHYGYKDTGILKDKKLDIYVAQDEEKKIKHKYFHLANKFDKLIKAKLVFFENGKRVKTIRSEE